MKSNNLSELSDLSGRNWSWVKLGEVCETTSGGTPSRKNPKYYDGKIPWIKSGELNFNTIRDSEEKITADAIENSNAKILEKGTLLIALYGATVGRLAFLGIEAATNQAVAAIFTPKNLSSKFLYWFLFSYREKLLTQRIGGAQPNISQGTLRNIPIPLPPLAEQKKIVEKIEELFSGLDNGVASLKKAKEQIKLYRQSVLAAAFSGRLHQDSTDSRIDKIKEKKSAKSKNPVNSNPDNQNPENPLIPANPGSDNLPVGWKWVKLGEVSLKIGDVDHKMPKSVENGKYPYLSTKDLTDDFKINFDNAKRISENDFHQLSKKIKPERGDIIFSRYGTIGRNVLVETDIDFLVSYSCAIIKPDSKMITSKYLYLYTLSPLIKSEIKKYTVQTTQANVGISSINNFIVPLPSKEIQQQIVLEIEKRFSEADNLEKAIDDSLAKSELLRQSILSQAFSGKLV